MVLNVDEFYMCDLCRIVVGAGRRNHYNPFVCTGCGKRICKNCEESGKHVHPKSAEELFREQHEPPKGKPDKRTYIATTGIVDEDDIPFWTVADTGISTKAFAEDYQTNQKGDRYGKV